MLKPRPYQSLATNNVQEKKINLIVMPQRSGKSFTMEMIIQTLQPKKTLIIVGYRKIILQLKNYFDDSTFILSGKPFNSNAAVHIASFQTLDNRNIDLSQYDCIIQDEYHSRTSKKAKSIVFQENTTICLFTGTPLDNKNRLLTKDIDNLIQPTSVKELIENKWLAPTQFSMNSNMIERNSQDLFTKKQDFDETVVRRIIQKEDLLELIKQQVVKDQLDTQHHTVIYVNYIATADALYQKLSDCNNVNIVHSKMTQKNQDQALLNYENSPAGIIISVRSLSLGWDSPKTDRLIYGLFTMIHSLALQILWRASTINPDDSTKVAKVYDMVGQLSTVNPYTNFKEYGRYKPSCKEQCKEFPENSIERHFCLETCTIPEDSFIICDGKPSYSFEEDPYRSDFKVYGTPCKQGSPFWAMDYKSITPLNSTGIIYKWSKCPNCGTKTRYTLHTMTLPSKAIEMYSDEVTIEQNEIIFIYNKPLKKGLMIISDLKLKNYKYKMVSSSDELYQNALDTFKQRTFAISSNINLKKLVNINIDSNINNLVPLVNWNNEQPKVMKQIIKHLVASKVEEFEMKKGFTFFFMKNVTPDIERLVFKKLEKIDDRYGLIKLNKQLEK